MPEAKKTTTDETVARRVANSMPSPTFAADSKGSVVFSSDSWLELTGLEETRALGSGWLAAVLDEDRERAESAWAVWMTDGPSSRLEIELRYRTAAAGVRWFSLHGVTASRELAKDWAYVVTSTDIHALRGIATGMRARNAAILEAAVDAILTIDDRGLIQSVNAACERVFGYTSTELVGQNVSVLMPAPYAEEHDANIQNYCVSGVAKIIGIGREVVGKHKDGHLFPIDLAVSEVRLEGTRLFTGIVRDITDRKRAVEELTESRRALSTLVGNLPGMAYRSKNDRDWTFEFVSKGSRDLTGYSPDEMTTEDGVHYGDLIHADDAERVWNEVQSAIEEKRPFRLTYRIFTRDGDERWVWEQGCAVRGEDGSLLALEGFIFDITERKIAQQKLVGQETLAKLGELSAIVAHEVKNPLAGIIGASRMLKRRLPEGSEEQEICDEMISRTQSLNDGVQDILSYAKPRTPVPRSIPVRALLEDVAALCRNDSQFANVVLKIEGEGLTVLCDAEMLKPVFLNLFVNAAQAMDGSGQICVTIESVEEDRFGRIVVHDSGPGIPDAQLDQIFEPFFTTKGGGTGLGLPIAKRVVELHGGSISIRCGENCCGGAGGGTSVTIDLPRVVLDDERP